MVNLFNNAPVAERISQKAFLPMDKCIETKRIQEIVCLPKKGPRNYFFNITYSNIFILGLSVIAKKLKEYYGSLVIQFIHGIYAYDITDIGEVRHFLS